MRNRRQSSRRNTTTRTAGPSTALPKGSAFAEPFRCCTLPATTQFLKPGAPIVGLSWSAPADHPVNALPSVIIGSSACADDDMNAVRASSVASNARHQKAPFVGERVSAIRLAITANGFVDPGAHRVLAGMADGALGNA